MRLADVRNAREHPLLDADLDERREQRRGQLNYQSRVNRCTAQQEQSDRRTGEGCAGWHFDVVAQFQVLHERKRLRKCLDGVPLEDL